MRNIIFLILIFMATVKTKAQLNTDVDATLASNSQIRAVDHRALEKDIIASYEDFVGSYTTAQIAALTGMTTRQVVYNTTDKEYEFYDGTRWVKMAHPKYKVYAALFTDNNPTPSVTILENTLGTVSWASDGAGTITVTSSNLFTSGKTFISFTPVVGTIGPDVMTSYIYGGIGVSAFTILTYNIAGGGTSLSSYLESAAIEIRVYY